MRGKKLILLTAVIFIGYCAWMIGPYLRSTLVRDSAVTSWSRHAVADIDGRIVSQLPVTGQTIGDDGIVARIENPLLFTEKRSVEEMREQVTQAGIGIKEADEQLSDLRQLERKRIIERDRLANVFHQSLETEITTLRDQIAVNTQRITVLERVVERSRTLRDRGVGSNADFDEASLRLADARAKEADLKSDLAFALLRDKASEAGVFIAADGSTPDWLRYGELELDLREQALRHERDRANARLTDARRGLELARSNLDDLTSAPVRAPAGALVFSVLVAPQAVVSAGQPVIEWIDCGILLVDVPVADAEIPLISKGDIAEVIMEGESETRKAAVLLTRGSAATIGRNDLAATAKGRTGGVAQVLLELDVSESDRARCPVGQSAYVRFPGIGLVDILRARLRL